MVYFFLQFLYSSYKKANFDHYRAGVSANETEVEGSLEQLFGDVSHDNGGFTGPHSDLSRIR